MRATAATSTFVGLMVAVLVGSAACAQDIAYDINQIQRALVIHGYNIGSVDGLLGTPIHQCIGGVSKGTRASSYRRT